MSDPLVQGLVNYIEQRRQQSYKNGGKIAPWSVIHYAEEHGAANHKHAVEVANAAMAQFPQELFGLRWVER